MRITNAFSLNMLAKLSSVIRVTEVTLEDAKQLLLEEGVDSCVGHADTAAVYTTTLGIEVLANRATISLGAGERALIGQYQGPRLPEGVSVLPESAKIIWCVVEVEG